MRRRLSPSRAGALLFSASIAFGALSAAPSGAHAEVFAEAAVAADHPLASEIGASILRRGGSAADAAIATALALGVLNPFASGIGGGGFLVYYDAESGETEALDFRETAPARARRDMFQTRDGVDEERFTHGGLTIAIPGEIAGFWALHQRYGKLPWASLFAPARELATEGYEVHELLVRRIERFAPDSEEWPALRAALTKPDGSFVELGDRIRRPALGRTLERIALYGPEAFYGRQTARTLLRAVRRAGGILTARDLANYEVAWRSPERFSYGGYDLVSMPLPSGGGLVQQEVFGTLEAFHLERVPALSSAWAHLVAEALKHAFAKRASTMGDPDQPGVIQPTAAGVRGRVEVNVDAYQPTRTLSPEDYGPLIGTDDDDGTSHISVVDRHGSAAALTTTINTSFGSLVLDPESGVLLNNEMNDFSPAPGVPNAFGLIGSEANAIVPGHRPLSSMSPTLVFHDGVLQGSLGASGGPMIITATLETFLHLIGGAETTEDAVEAPRIHHQWAPFILFLDPEWSSETREALEARGHIVREALWSASVQAIWRRADGWDAASDTEKLGGPAGY